MVIPGTFWRSPRMKGPLRPGDLPEVTMSKGVRSSGWAGVARAVPGRTPGVSERSVAEARSAGSADEFL
jgi:hypothetical protein